MRKRTCKIAAQNYKNTCLRKYNKSSVFETEYFKHESANTKLEKYNDARYNNRKQAQLTCKTRYGTNTYFFGPELVFKTNVSGLFKRKVGIKYYPKYSNS